MRSAQHAAHGTWEHTSLSEDVMGNIFVRRNRMRKGEVIHGHAHAFDHVSYCTHGAVTVRAGEQVRTIRASDDRNYILIRAGVEHEITALEERTKFDCVYSHRTPQGEVVEEYTGWDQAYV